MLTSYTIEISYDNTATLWLPLDFYQELAISSSECWLDGVFVDVDAAVIMSDAQFTFDSTT
jgi:hypothetical protein